MTNNTRQETTATAGSQTAASSPADAIGVPAIRLAQQSRIMILSLIILPFNAGYAYEGKMIMDKIIGHTLTDPSHPRLTLQYSTNQWFCP